MRRHPILVLLLVAACAPDTSPPRPPEEPEDTLPAPPFNLETLPPDSLHPEQAAADLPARPRTRSDTLMVEGMPQVEQQTLVRSPEGFQPAFTTYLPAGMRVEFSDSDSVAAARFIAAFGGQDNPDAYLQVRIYPRGAAELVVRNAVDVYLRGRDPRQTVSSPSSRWPWSIDAYDFSYGGGRGADRYVGTIAIARHGNRFLHVLAHYPQEYGDGMPPRIQGILDAWRWEATGEMLAQGAR